jgi:type IV pilus assembly protein PilM
LDIGHDSVKMIQIERAGDMLSVQAAALGALPPEARANPQSRVAKAAPLIRQWLRQHSFRGRRVVAALPRELVYIRHLRLPPVPAADLDAAVRSEAKALLPFDPAEAQVQFLPVGEVRDGGELRQEVILLAARHQDVNEFIETMSGAGLVLEALDVEACAMYRAVDRFVRRRDDEQEVHVLVDIGAHCSQVVIGRGRQIGFIKSIEIGGRHFQEAVSRKLGITLDEAQSLRRRLVDPAEAPVDEKDPVRQAAHDATRAAIEDLGREISRCLRYYAVTFRGHGPTRLRLIGGEAADPQLLATLNKLLAIPAEVSKPLLSLDTRRMSSADGGGALAVWGMALGLALKCVPGPFGPRDGKPRQVVATAADFIGTTEAACA